MYTAFPSRENVNRYLRPGRYFFGDLENALANDSTWAEVSRLRKQSDRDGGEYGLGHFTLSNGREIVFIDHVRGLRYTSGVGGCCRNDGRYVGDSGPYGLTLADGLTHISHGHVRTYKEAFLCLALKSYHPDLMPSSR